MQSTEIVHDIRTSRKPKAKGKPTPLTNLLFSFYFCLLGLAVMLCGCNNMARVSFEQSGAEGAVPVSLKYIPADKLTKILNEVMGTDNKVLFISDRTGETFVGFDPNSGEPVRMAQVRRIANSKGSAVILLGLSTVHNPESITKVYSFEYGESMPGIALYTFSKDRFLQQFVGRRIVRGIGKIDGITGATPIWKPMAEEITSMVKKLIILKRNSEFIHKIKTEGKLWQPFLAMQAAGPSEQFQQQLSARRPKADFLFSHWRLIGIAELGLLSTGIFIVTFTQLKKWRHRQK